MSIRVGINGFGRIGRNFFRAAKKAGADIDFVAVNDLGSVETMAHLLKYDSVLGRLDYDIEATQEGIKVDGDDLRRAVQSGGHDRGKPDRTSTDHNHHVADLDLPVAHPDLVAGRQDIGQHRPLLRRHAVGQRIHRRLRERNPHVLGLGAVNQVAEDPADPRGALVGEAVREHPFLAHVAMPAGAYAGHDDAIAY